MATAKVMYWKEIPVQLQATDESGTVKRALDNRFQEGADAIAMFDGSYGEDAYLEGWAWGEELEIQGPARSVADQLVARYNDRFPRDFIQRIRRRHQDGTRDPRPGAVDLWLGDGE